MFDRTNGKGTGMKGSFSNYSELFFSIDRGIQKRSEIFRVSNVQQRSDQFYAHSYHAWNSPAIGGIIHL